MNTRALFPLLFTVASFSASAGNWAVKNGWCQTMTEDGQALVMLKKWHDWYYRPDAGMPEWCTDALGQPYQY
ncbi:hypothetical protein MY014_41420 [Escherichia coli]|nr:hypothetical protein MY014_41420 [Escherichia coli]